MSGGGELGPRPWRRPGRRAPVVLLYHGFCLEPRRDDPENLFVTVDALDEQVGWLRQEGWRLLSWTEWHAASLGHARPPRRSVLITIDDAYDSVPLALDVLRRHRAPCVVYVPAGLMGRTATWLPEPADEPLLSADELRALASDLVEVGVHGWDHTSMRERSSDDLRRQVVDARAVLEEELGGAVTTVPSFAYPFGDHDAAARSAVAQAGFDSAFSVHDDVGRFAISRVDVNATDSLRSFRLKLMPGYRRAWRALDRASVVRRAVRRMVTAS